MSDAGVVPALVVDIVFCVAFVLLAAREWRD